MIIFSEIFYEIAALLAVAATIATLGLRLRQPLIVSFIAVGLLLGPAKGAGARRCPARGRAGCRAAVDYLTASREELSALAPWPVTLEEVKLRPDSAASGKRIGELAHRVLEERESIEEEKKSFRMAELTLGEDSDWAGKTLAELGLRRRRGISVIGIERGGQRIFSPLPQEVLQPADTLLVIGHPDAFRACLERGAV